MVITNFNLLFIEVITIPIMVITIPIMVDGDYGHDVTSRGAEELLFQRCLLPDAQLNAMQGIRHTVGRLLRPDRASGNKGALDGASIADPPKLVLHIMMQVSSFSFLLQPLPPAI